MKSTEGWPFSSFIVHPSSFTQSYGEKQRVPRRESHYHGLLIVDKPGLPAPPAQPQPEGSAVATPPRLHTSHDIVQLVRRWSGQRRIGHTGTLDPMASGVLVLCLGQATRLVEYYQGHDKQYYAEITLGAATDTYDRMGAVVAESPVPPLTVTAIEAALATFRGEIRQLPPIYSALKQEGESLHHKARRGETVTVEPRPVTIHQLQLIDFRPPDQITLRVRCSAGTYIRSLAHDLGLALQTHAHLSALRREAAGPFALADAHTLAAVEAAGQAETLEKLLLPLGYGLPLPELKLDAEASRRLGHGQVVALPNPATQPLPSLAKGVTSEGVLLGILHALQPASAGNGEYLWKADKWFAGAPL
ncbi:MAG: tRNA pseudouridine(55) synthase TruB [Caldilinea sp. CFX5]|nr:tRNA pseudouridine(55) synthase TruB [Caldilinea sp. CFX5]